MRNDENDGIDPNEAAAAEPVSPDMMPLHPGQLSVIRINLAIISLLLVGAAIWFDFWVLRQLDVPGGALSGAALLLASAGLIILPGRRYRAWAYREEEDELHVHHGVLVRVRTIVPFGRVQHIDVAQGPIERRFGLARLILHTAGTRSAHIPLPGLLHKDAEAMRDRIRSKIRQDLL